MQGPPVARKPLRPLVADGQLYLYSAGWRVDLDGERIISVALFHAETGREQVPRGKAMRANFLARNAENPPPGPIAHPHDVRAVLEAARLLGWDGKREGWLLPASGLERPDLVLTGPTRLRAWADEQPVFILDIDEAEIAGRLASALGLPPVPAARDAAEAQWRDDRMFLLRCRFGRFARLYTRNVADLALGLHALQRRAPQLGAVVSARPAQLVAEGELPAADIIPPEHWGELPDANPHPGFGENDVVWTIPSDDGPRIEAYQFHPDAPDRLWRWTSLHGSAAIERRFA
jgi:hypothetical protein